MDEVTFPHMEENERCVGIPGGDVEGGGTPQLLSKILGCFFSNFVTDVKAKDAKIKNEKTQKR